MSHLKDCSWCRKSFESERSDARFCSSGCRSYSSKILRDFTKVADLVPESEVESKYRVAAAVESCHILVYWFRIGGKRFGDVYASKDCDLSVLERIKRNRSVKNVYAVGLGRVRWKRKDE